MAERIKWTKEMQEFMIANRNLSVRQIAAHFGVARNTVYKKLNLYLYKKEQKENPKPKEQFKRPAAVYSNLQYDDMINEILKRKL